MFITTWFGFAAVLTAGQDEGRVCPDESLEGIAGWVGFGNFRCCVALFGKDLFCNIVFAVASGFACLHASLLSICGIMSP